MGGALPKLLSHRFRKRVQERRDREARKCGVEKRGQYDGEGGYGGSSEAGGEQTSEREKRKTKAGKKKPEPSLLLFTGGSYLPSSSLT